MYYFYLGNMVLPITPAGLNISYGNQNKTLTLINEGEINILKEAKLSDISFDFLLPAQQYAFAAYKSSFISQQTYLELLKKLKKTKKPFQFIVVRFKPNNSISFFTNIKVSLENYVTKESADEGLDLIVSVKLKEYKDYGTKTLIVNADNNTATVQQTRDISTSPMPDMAVEHVISSGETLWEIAKKTYGDGNKYVEIAAANDIKNPTLIVAGQNITLPKL